jgi:hypothetical protein
MERRIRLDKRAKPQARGDEVAAGAKWYSAARPPGSARTDIPTFVVTFSTAGSGALEATRQARTADRRLVAAVLDYKASGAMIEPESPGHSHGLMSVSERSRIAH